MTGARTVIAAVGLVLVVQPLELRAQSASHSVAGLASLASGSIGGVVQDERGAPIAGAMVSALGPKMAVTVTDRAGRFELKTLSPGPYLLRAHITGYVGSRGHVVEVRPSARTASSIALRHVSPAASSAGTSEPLRPVLTAGVGAAPEAAQVEPAPADAIEVTETVPGEAEARSDDHSEKAWRLRHVRRGVLREVTLSDDLLADGAPEIRIFAPSEDRAVAALFDSLALSGQFNLLTTGSFETPKQLFTDDNFSRNIAYVSLTAPVGAQADWSMRGALTQGDISSWFVAGAYTTRVPARHRYELGLSYSTQRYDGGNPAALRSVTDGSRNVGAVYGVDTFAVTPNIVVTYGARLSHYDYLGDTLLFNPRVAVTLSPADHFRVNALASSRAHAPGAEEFLPPMDGGLWLPPQRTFSALVAGRPLQPERSEHLAVEAERDFGASTVSVRAFRQRVDDQLITVFGFEAPGAPRADLGHYFVGNTGDFDAIGWSAAFRTTWASRVNSSVAYSTTNARWNHLGDSRYLLVIAPSLARPALDRVHDLSTTVETNLPETATRIIVAARMATAGTAGAADRTTYDPRFDVQVHQSLPFMDFSTARWEMLLAVRNVFHDAIGDSSIYDELMVVRPPKRIVGGLTLRF